VLLDAVDRDGFRSGAVRGERWATCRELAVREGKLNATEHAVRELVRAVPELEPIWREHLEDNYGDPLSHIFLGTVALRIGDAAERRGRLPSWIASTANELEALLADGDPEVENLIAVSFAELLPSHGRPARKLRAKFGPRLTALARQMA
jgi:hypothetical protein